MLLIQQLQTTETYFDVRWFIWWFYWWSFLFFYFIAATAKVNGVRFLFSQLDYQQVISILGQFNDQDSVVLQFPLRVKTSNYTEVTWTIKQSTMLSWMHVAESSGQAAITSLNINFLLQF
jgi:hypothetical protein